MSHHVLQDDEPLVIINYSTQVSRGNKHFYKMSEDENLLQAIMKILYQRNINSLVVEGGASLLQAFIDSGLWDEARIITNTDLNIKSGLDAPVLNGGRIVDSLSLMNDKLEFISNDVFDK